MTKPVINKLYSQEELRHKIESNIEKLKQYRAKEDYPSIISIYYDIGRLYEILGDKEESKYYYEKIINEWNIHPDDSVDYICIDVLKVLNRPEEALKIVLEHPVRWDPDILADLYKKMGREKEARLIYFRKAHFSLKLSQAYCLRAPFWQPHYLQKTADLYEKAQNFEKTHIYNKKAVKMWEKVKNNIQKSLELIEEAWLYEEVGYIYEKAGKLKNAMRYYKNAQKKYKEAYSTDPEAVYTNQLDGEWDRYFEFFTEHMIKKRLIYFYSDGPKENDYRRIKYRMLNLEE